MSWETAVNRPGRARRVVRQDQGEGGEGREHGQGGAGTLHLKALLMMADAARQQAEPDDAVADQHHGGEGGVARERRGFGSAGQHHGDDQSDFDHRYGEREDQRAERLPEPVRHDLGVIDGSEYRGDQNNRKGYSENPAALDVCRARQQNPGQEGPDPGPPR